MATPTKVGDKPVKPKTAAATKKPATPAKPAVKPKAVAQPKATAQPAAAPKAKPVKAAKVAQPASGARAVAAEQRRYYVEVAAYYIAERRGFQGGDVIDDWAAAEAEVERLLRAGVINS
ncbi:MAG: DUF2934 domain-containing protein [Rhodocyclaceae bacterium]|nr:DUF2934 domain-containing protein [Rhodocyclaceae bacterium]